MSSSGPGALPPPEDMSGRASGSGRGGTRGSGVAVAARGEGPRGGAGSVLRRPKVLMPAAVPLPAAVPVPGTATFSDLTVLIKQAGLLRRRRGAYAAVFAGNALLAAVALAAFVALGSSWGQLGTAVLLGLVSTQLAFVGHDAGHRQIFASRRAN